jgi:hypothetical protein
MPTEWPNKLILGLTILITPEGKARLLQLCSWAGVHTVAQS